MPDRYRPTRTGITYRGRYTELWYDSVEAWKEAAPYTRPYTQAPWGGLSATARPTATIIIPAMPTDDFLGKSKPTPEERPFLRWIFTMRYPDGVSIDDGEKWYFVLFTLKRQSRCPVSCDTSVTRASRIRRFAHRGWRHDRAVVQGL